MAKRVRGSASTGPTGTPRAGRREHDRTLDDRRPLLERYRTALVVVGALPIVTIVGGFVFIQTTSKAHACSTILLPEPAATAAPGGTTIALGQPAGDLGRQHVTRGQSITYTYCPPSSGSHCNDLPDGPIPAKLYGKDEPTLDIAGLRAFWGRYADRGPEPQCQEAIPGYSPSPAHTASPSASTAP